MSETSARELANLGSSRSASSNSSYWQSLLSADSNRPLIIDQPEDNLDEEFIYQSVVPVLRRAKERRQVIVVTHDANIAVLGDAEQIVVFRALGAESVLRLL